MVASQRTSSPKPKTSDTKTPAATAEHETEAKYTMPKFQFPQLFDALVTGFCVFGGLYIISLLDAHPMPFLTKGGVYDFGLKDIKFYCPPHGAIAVILMTAKDLPNLYKMGLAIFIGAASAVSMVELGARFGLANDQAYIRSAAVAIATILMKINNNMFAPAAALAALFVDNKAMQSGVGKAYVLMPGISGTIVLFLLAYIKVTLTTMCNTSEKKEL